MPDECGFDPDWTVAPGDLLREELAAHHITQRQLAQQIGRPEQTISEIINGKKAITAETALQLEAALGVSAWVWVQFEARYRLDLAQGKKRFWTGKS